MKKKLITIFMIAVLSISVAGCGSEQKSVTEDAENVGSETESQKEEEKEEEIKEPTNLSGIWTSENRDGSYQEAVITESSIEINWVSDEGATKSIYWAGTYTAPNEFVEEYSWVSDRDKEKTDSALLASTDDTKEFIYKNGKISYEVSAMGTTTTVELTQTSSELPSTSSSDADVQNEEASYEVTYQNISFHQDSIGTLWSQAIVEVTNTGNNNLYLDYSSYELTAEDGTIIHTTSNSFIPYPQIIEPGEKGYYYEEQTMDSQTPTNGITITPHISAKAATVENLRMEVSNTEIYDKDMGGIDVHGKIKNTTGAEQSNVYVAAILFNADGQPIGQLFTVLVNTLQPDEEIGFELEPMGLPESITRSSIADYKIFAYPEQFQF